jgi:hypothetical protein
VHPGLLDTDGEAQDPQVSSSVYLETSIVSYLTSLPSRDLITAAHQELTRMWWSTRGRFELFISQAVLSEAAAGDPEAAARRLGAVGGIPILEVTPAVLALARDFLRSGAVPPKAFIDGVHVAAAALHGIDYLLTWNCRHIANAAIRSKLEESCRNHGFHPPVICTPEELAE